MGLSPGLQPTNEFRIMRSIATPPHQTLEDTLKNFHHPLLTQINTPKVLGSLTRWQRICVCDKRGRKIILDPALKRSSFREGWYLCNLQSTVSVTSTRGNLVATHKTSLTYSCLLNTWRNLEDVLQTKSASALLHTNLSLGLFQCLYISTKCQITKAKQFWFPTFRLLLHYIDEQFITILRAGQSEFDSRERLGLLFPTQCPDRLWYRPLASTWWPRQVCAFRCTLHTDASSSCMSGTFVYRKVLQGFPATQHYVHMM